MKKAFIAGLLCLLLAASSWGAGIRYGSGISKGKADSDYVNITGDDMTGKLTITPGTVDQALTLNQDNDEIALEIDSEATTAGKPCAYFHGKYGLQVAQDISNGYGMLVDRNVAEAGSNPLVLLRNEHSSDTQGVLSLQSDGTGPHILTAVTNENLEIDPNGVGKIVLRGNLSMEVGTIEGTSNQASLDIIPATGDYLRVGDAGTTSQSLAANDDLFVSGKLEIDGNSWFEADTRHTSDVILGFGNSLFASLMWNTTQTNDTLLLGLGSTTRTLLITENADRTTDFGHADQTNPTIILHSSDATDITQWLGLTHNQTDGKITTGTGNISIEPASEITSVTGDLHVTQHATIAGTVYTGQFEFQADSGMSTAFDKSVTSASGLGTQESVSFKIDGETQLKLYTESDGAGGITEESVRAFVPTRFYDLAILEALSTCPVVSGTREGSMWCNSGTSSIEVYLNDAWWHVTVTAK